MKIKKLVFSILIILVCLSTTSCSKKVENCYLTVGVNGNPSSQYIFVLHNRPTYYKVLNLDGSPKMYYYITYATINKTKIVIYTEYGFLNKDKFRKVYTETFTVTNYSYYKIN